MIPLKKVTHILYLHGFRSSPLSAKSQIFKEWFLKRDRDDLFWYSPQLPPSPKQAMNEIRDFISTLPPDSNLAIIGSSLGGFYATFLSYKIRSDHHSFKNIKSCLTVLINPGVDPANSLVKHVGKQKMWHSPELEFEFTLEHIQELQHLTDELNQNMSEHLKNYDPQTNSNLKDEILAVIAKGDEFIDWNRMDERYRGQPNCRIRLIEEGDHGLVIEFETFILGEIISFLEI